MSLTGCFPELAAKSAVTRRVDEGWDAEVLVLESDELVRLPRRTEVQAAMIVEVHLLAEFAPNPDVPAPVPVDHCELHGSMVYEALSGEPLDDGLLDSIGEERLIEELARFLAAVWSFPRDRAAELGVRRRDLRPVLRTFRHRVLPLVNDSHASQLLERADELMVEPAEHAVVVHGDLGPAHVLCTDDGLQGVIDWSDVSIADPAIDLAWLLNGCGRRLRDGLVDTLALELPTVERADLVHQLGPWWEVLYGLDEDRPALVASGLEGVRSRLHL